MAVTIKSRYDDGKALYVAEHASDVRQAVTEAVKSGANLYGANLHGANLHGAHLCSANLHGADLHGADLHGANLHGADLHGANLYGANLHGANLHGADLHGANLHGAHLCSANLHGADLHGANLHGAHRHGAHLCSANLHGADLHGANLYGANLYGAHLHGAKGLNPRHVNDLLILKDQPGKIRAYKLVTVDGFGPVQGGLRYVVGETVEVPDANTDETVKCAAGINVATLPWCVREWRPGYRILVVEFTAKDIAAIPLSDGKFRLRKARVIRDLDLVELGLVDSDADAKRVAA